MRNKNKRNNPSLFFLPVVVVPFVIPITCPRSTQVRSHHKENDPTSLLYCPLPLQPISVYLFFFSSDAPILAARGISWLWEFYPVSRKKGYGEWTQEKADAPKKERREEVWMWITRHSFRVSDRCSGGLPWSLDSASGLRSVPWFLPSSSAFSFPILSYTFSRRGFSRSCAHTTVDLAVFRLPYISPCPVQALFIWLVSTKKRTPPPSRQDLCV